MISCTPASTRTTDLRSRCPVGKCLRRGSKRRACCSPQGTPSRSRFAAGRRYTFCCHSPAHNLTTNPRSFQLGRRLRRGCTLRWSRAVPRTERHSLNAACRPNTSSHTERHTMTTAPCTAYRTQTNARHSPRRAGRLPRRQDRLLLPHQARRMEPLRRRQRSTPSRPLRTTHRRLTSCPHSQSARVPAPAPAPATGRVVQRTPRAHMCRCTQKMRLKTPA